MGIPTVSTFVDGVMIRPIIVAVNSLVLSSLMSFVIAGRLDWRPIAVCTTSDILAVGVDHLKDKEDDIRAGGAAVVKRFAPLAYVARIFLALNALLLVIALSQCPPKMSIITVIFTAPAFLWATPLQPRRIGGLIKKFIFAKHDKDRESASPISSKPFIIKRVPGMKAIFNGIIRGCGIFFVVQSALQFSQKSNQDTSPWTIMGTVIWSTVNRTCHSIMTDVRDFDDDFKAGVPTIPVLLGSPFKTRILLTIVQTAIMMAYLGNPYILTSSCFAIALAWILGKDSPKVSFFLSIHSQSMFIVMYAVVQSGFLLI
ncbi:uncharacterized protein EDB91DRAFT_327957 [Suillus paluster]|uniref:uncharacterized protein n=1 Tax=Suillus paluster TaxID=48578 RepID=UPI001B85B8AA|nr:uncharacterized protein EDB91DRAFT_327957 [Suillus paluster]KAG1741420.1 hypothetical protein EDB91DRAFT_327957 [Suillus paluster]